MKRKKAALSEANNDVLAPETFEEDAAPERAEKAGKKTGRLFTIISYLIALASLLAALFVPLYNGKMIFQLVWAAADKMLQFLNINTPTFAYGDFFIAQSMRIYESAIILGIAGSTLLALIMLLPVTICKKPQGANLRCALAAEFIAFSFVTACAMWEMLHIKGSWQNFVVLIPFGVLILVMSAQSIKFKGSLGVAKFFIFLFSLLTLFTLFNITALIPALEEPFKTFSATIGAYSKDVTYIGKTPSGLSVVSELVRVCAGKSSFTNPADTLAFINQIISTALVLLVLISIFADCVSLIAGSKKDKNGRVKPHKVWFVFAAIRYSAIILLIAASAILSFTVAGYTKVGLYMYFTFVFVLLAFITEIIRYCVAKSKAKAYDKEHAAEEQAAKDGEQLVIQDDSLAGDLNANSYQTTESTDEQMTMLEDQPEAEVAHIEEEVEETPAEATGEQVTVEEIQNTEEEKVEPAAEAIAEESVEIVEAEAAEVESEPAEEVVEEEVIQPVDEVEETEATAVVEEAPVEEPVVAAAEQVESNIETADEVVNPFVAEEAPKAVSIDPFIDTLTDEERVQFYDVFINRNKGKFSYIPAYKINENNSDFFPSVFIHINRMRNLCSDSLLSKIYKEIDKD